MVSNTSSKDLFRGGSKLKKKLADIKEKNNLSSLKIAGDEVVNILDGITTKKKLRRKIIEEIEF